MQKIKKGDNVQILIGKDSGKTGTVERLLAKEGKVWVGGINVYKRHVKKQGGVDGGVIDITKPVNISNIILVCPNCKKVTRVGFKQDGKDMIRICKKCKKVIK